MLGEIARPNMLDAAMRAGPAAVWDHAGPRPASTSRTLTVRVFVPELIDADGNSQIRRDEYVLAVPEVSDLVAFTRTMFGF